LTTVQDQHFVEHVSYYHKFVEEYSALRLTKHTDRLQAIHGLCTRIRPSRGNFASGFWMDSILNDLMWRVPGFNLDSIGLEPSQGPFAGNKFPSWSCAATKDPVEYWADILELPAQPNPRLLGPLAPESPVASVSDEDPGSVLGHMVYTKLMVIATIRHATLVYQYGSSK
jgi:hypothetical protein